MLGIVKYLKKQCESRYNCLKECDINKFIYGKNKSRCSSGVLLPKLSIVIPSFNQVKYLERTLLSVINQNYPNIELIIIDGGSVDGTVDVIKKYEKYISYWVSEPDKGQADALNKGIALSTGDYIGWQNSDDIYLPKAFELLKEPFLKGYDLVVGNVLSINDDDQIIDYSHFVKPSYKAMIYVGMIMSSQAVFWRRTCCEEINFSVTYNHAMDYDMWLKMFKCRPKVFFCCDYLGAFRRYEGTKTVEYGFRGVEEVNEIRRLHGFEPTKLSFKLISLLMRYYRLISYCRGC